MSRRRLDPLFDLAFHTRNAALLAFFGERLSELRLFYDDKLAEHGIATEAGVSLGPTALHEPREASVLAHELFHAWARSAVPAAEWRELSCLTPHFAPAGASLEELATDLLARGLCKAGFIPSYPLTPPPVDLLQRRLRAARVAVRAALLRPVDAERLQTARSALARLSGHELSALALLEAGAETMQLRWPKPIWTEVAALHHNAQLALTALAAPQLLRTLCRFLAVRRWNDRRRGPLWDGDSPLELPGRLLQQRARAGDLDQRHSVLIFLEAMAERLSFLAPL